MRVKVNNVTFTTMNGLLSIEVENLHLFSGVYSWRKVGCGGLAFATGSFAI